MSQNQTLRNVASLAVLATAITALIFALDIGLGEHLNAIIDPDDPVDPLAAETMAAFGGDVGVLDRIVALGMVFTIVGAGGLSLYSAGRGDPGVIRNAQMWMPWLVGAIGLVAFTETSWDIITGEFDFSAGNSANNMYLTYIAFSMVTAVLGLFGHEPKNA
jgi:hypothetical protein